MLQVLFLCCFHSCRFHFHSRSDFSSGSSCSSKMLCSSLPSAAHLNYLFIAVVVASVSVNSCCSPRHSWRGIDSKEWVWNSNFDLNLREEIRLHNTMQNSGIWFRNGAEKSNLHLYTLLHVMHWEMGFTGKQHIAISQPSWEVCKGLHFFQAEVSSPKLRFGCLYDLNTHPV